MGKKTGKKWRKREAHDRAHHCEVTYYENFD